MVSCTLLWVALIAAIVVIFVVVVVIVEAVAAAAVVVIVDAWCVEGASVAKGLMVVVIAVVAVVVVHVFIWVREVFFVGDSIS